MKTLAVVALLAVAGVALWKHRLGISVTTSATAGTAEASGYPSGVSSYTPIIASQTPQQVLAAQITHPDQVTEVGYAPAFGDSENQCRFGEQLM
jgi:hypothetical protein